MSAGLPRVLTDDLVRAALQEDLGRAGDVTTTAIARPGQPASGDLVAREAGVVAGLDLAIRAFELLDPALTASGACPDGTRVAPGDVLAHVSGQARALLGAERVALNFCSHLSGVATATAELVEAVRGTSCRVTCTRKTTPGLRAVEKAAVRAGGGSNHRFGLDDAVLVKDNHVLLAGGVREAVRRVRQAAGHLLPIAVEVDTLTELRELRADPVDVVLLDNMDPATLREAVALVDGRMTTEASGRITAKTAPAIAATGVDVISAGWLTHSAPILDIGLDLHLPSA